MKKTLLIVMACMLLIAAVGCREDNRKDNTPMTTPSAEVIPDPPVVDDPITDGEGTGDIPENGVDSGKDNAEGNDMMNGDGIGGNGTNDNAVNTPQDNGTSAAPELVPSQGADAPKVTEDVKE